MRGLIEVILELYTRLQEFDWIKLVGASRDEVFGWVKEFYIILLIIWDNLCPIICIWGVNIPVEANQKKFTSLISRVVGAHTSLQMLEDG